MPDTIYDVGIYCRLSNDDERSGESVSIENQKLLLEQYVKTQGWNQVDVYIDDGYSGTNFERPGVQRLIKDAKNKQINLILVKDLSRFGRNYIEFGQYIDYLFPSIGCRFVALNNGIDTMNQDGSTDMMCFLNLFNEFYCRDTSKKVKAVKRACAENGKFMGTYPAYGYRRDPVDKHHLIIDEETAPVVRQIFSMRSAGIGYRGIAEALNGKELPPPGTLYYLRNGQTDPRNVSHKWTDSTVSAILRNEVYIGNLVQGKCGTISYKNKKLIAKPKETWIRAASTHEPIISRDLWDCVSQINRQKIRKSPTADGIKSMVSGLIYCGDCGNKMRNQVERFTYQDGRAGRYSSFVCGNYARSGKSACTAHTIYESALLQILSSQLSRLFQLSCWDKNRCARQGADILHRETMRKITSCDQERHACSVRCGELKGLMQHLYEDQLQEVISKAVAETLMHTYEVEYREKSQRLADLEQRRTLLSNIAPESYTNTVCRCMELLPLDEWILFALIQRIEIGQARISSGQRVCEVKIQYKFSGGQAHEAGL